MKHSFKILFVGSDNFHNRQFVTRLSRHAHVELVSWLTSGTAALNQDLHLFSSLIIVDVLTDDMSGIELTRWLSEQDRNLKVLMVSERLEMEFLHASKEMRLNGYFPKNISTPGLDQLFESLKNNAGGYQYALSFLIFPKWIKQFQEALWCATPRVFKLV